MKVLDAVISRFIEAILFLVTGSNKQIAALHDIVHETVVERFDLNEAIVDLESAQRAAEAHHSSDAFLLKRLADTIHAGNAFVLDVECYISEAIEGTGCLVVVENRPSEFFAIIDNCDESYRFIREYVSGNVEIDVVSKSHAQQISDSLLADAVVNTLG